MGHPDFRAAARVFSTLSPPEGDSGMVKLTPLPLRAGRVSFGCFSRRFTCAAHSQLPCWVSAFSCGARRHGSPPQRNQSRRRSAPIKSSRVAKAYAGCKSYRDSGVVKTVYVEAGRTRTEMKPFKTAFVRPDQFRFEYTQKRGEGAHEVNRYIVWRRGTDVRTWWDVKPGIEKPASLALALAGATGVSGGSAHACRRSWSQRRSAGGRSLP
jgi:hypothetical protein